MSLDSQTPLYSPIPFKHLLSYIGIDKLEDAELLVVNGIALLIRDPPEFRKYLTSPKCPFSGQQNIVELHEEVQRLGAKYDYDFREAFGTLPTDSLQDPLSFDQPDGFRNRALYSQKRRR